MKVLSDRMKKNVSVFLVIFRFRNLLTKEVNSTKMDKFESKVGKIRKYRMVSIS